MPHPDRRTVKLFLTALTFVVVPLVATAPEAQCQDKGAPLWGEFLKRFKKDKLLKKPFVNAPEEAVKGLASKLRARELDIPNRLRAVDYLSTFHCTKFPEARDMLIDVLHNDKWEPVRYQAAIALRNMFANCACDAEDEVTDQDRQRGAPDAGSPRHCACCCDAKTLESIAKVAYELKDNGCPSEPSRRIREMAVEAIKVCGVPCCFKPYMSGDEQGPPAWDTDDKDDGSGGGEVVPPPIKELTPVPLSGDGRLSIPTVRTVVPKPIARLSNLCLVSLKQGQHAAADPGFSAEYRGRIYHFASQSARDEFQQNPEEYAVAFGGCDPVHFVETREVVEGRYLVMHNRKFYMFATQENFQRFKSDIVRYTGAKTRTSELALAR